MTGPADESVRRRPRIPHQQATQASICAASSERSSGNGGNGAQTRSSNGSALCHAYLCHGSFAFCGAHGWAACQLRWLPGDDMALYRGCAPDAYSRLHSRLLSDTKKDSARQLIIPNKASIAFIELLIAPVWYAQLVTESGLRVFIINTEYRWTGSWDSRRASHGN